MENTQCKVPAVSRTYNPAEKVEYIKVTEEEEAPRQDTKAIARG